MAELKENTYIGEHHNVLDKGFVVLVDSMGTDADIVAAARVSYGKGTKKLNDDRTLLRYLFRHLHTSPVEQVEWKFHMKMPIFVARQIVRHRTAGLNEYSGRYSEMKSEFYLPDTSRILAQSTTNKQGSGDELDAFVVKRVLKMMEEEQLQAYKNYETYLKFGVSREIARINLPLSMYTEWYWKMDLHNLFHFLKLRMDEHAQWETRQYAEAVYKIIEPKVPLAVEAFNDYIRNSKRFSAEEVDLLIELLMFEGKEELTKRIKDTIGTYKLSKRERKEFKQKIGL